MGLLDLTVEPVSPADHEGLPFEGETAGEFVVRLAADKASRVARAADGAIVLGADTAVVLDSDVLGKPANDAEAVRLLRRLRGRVHTVVTGVAALDARSGRQLSAATSTEVTMRDYSDDELAEYAASGEPLDKAGGYAVQDEKFHPVQAIRGCYLNVVGLPLCDVVRLLDGLGVRARLRRHWPVPVRCRACSLKDREETFLA